MIKNSAKKLETYFRLGINNLIWVIIYRCAIKSGFIEKLTRKGPCITGPFFIDTKPEINESLISLNLKVFGWLEYSKKTPPVWNKSITSGKCVDVQYQHWSKISDFDLAIGDIKTVWEMSRFDWLLYFTVEFLKSGDGVYLETLNVWLEDWSYHNPVNQGVNWKCGQETSIRVMHLCLTSILLEQHKTLTASVIKMLEQHLARISPTVLYAMAQDNNHGTSEAVALYIGGLLLENNTDNALASKWKKQGRYWIENRVKRLIANDGSFSQHSVNYHRLMLDSLCLAELIRQKFSDSRFTQKALIKIHSAIDWLSIFTDSTNGDAPNLGANDGALIIPLSGSDYRDYRPTVQLASAVFFGIKYYSSEGRFNQSLKLLSLNVEAASLAKEQSRDFSDGGYVYIEKNNARLYMRYPKFRFRPSQCDVFHIDFWFNDKNILRDAGSYSYNTEQRWLDYFPGTEAHNTIQFDGQEQMPRLSRFLYGDWLNVKESTGVYQKDSATCFRAGYQSSNNIRHYRGIRMLDFELIVVDDVSGFDTNAVLRWRLAPGDYEIQGCSLIADGFEINIDANVTIKRIEIIEGWESRYYMNKTVLPVLEVEVTEAARIITTIKLSPAQG